MANVGKSDKPAGSGAPGSARSSASAGLARVALALAGGLALAVASAGLVWVWEAGPFPTFMVLTSLLQGVLLGLGLSALFRRTRPGGGITRVMLGGLCGAAGVVLVHAAHYVHDVYQVRDRLVAERQGLARFGEDAGAFGGRAADEVRADPFGAVDRLVLVPETGRRGLIGHMVLRSRAGIRVGGRDEGEVFVWAVWAVEAALVVGLAGWGAGRKGNVTSEE